MVATLAMHGSVRSELLEGLCLFRIATRRRVGGEGPDPQKAAEILQLLDDRVKQIVHEVGFWLDLESVCLVLSFAGLM